MATNNIVKSDLYKIHHVVQGSMIVFPKEAIISFLRDHFSRDSYYHYSKDEWGFANVVDHTDLPLGSGLHDDTTTRVFIGENYRFDGIYYPAILVKNGGSRSVPISINREEGAVQWAVREFNDGYGNRAFYKYPESFLFQGAWEGSIIIDVVTRSIRARDDLLEIVAMCLTDISFKALQKIGVVIKPLNIGSPSEIDDRNDKLFKQSITLEIRSEWRRELPINNIIEIINFSMDFADVSNNSPVATNLSINTRSTLLDNLMSVLFLTTPTP